MIQLKIASAVALTFGLTLASANLAKAADDSMSSGTTDTTTSPQKPGTMGSTTTESKETTTTHMTEHWKTAKNCTDESGVTYKKGQKGFKTCIEAMRKKEQMGGTTPTQPESGMSGGSMSGSSMSGSGSSGSTSDTSNQ